MYITINSAYSFAVQEIPAIKSRIKEKIVAHLKNADNFP